MSQLGNLYAFHFLFAPFLFLWSSCTRMLLSLALKQCMKLLLNSLYLLLFHLLGSFELSSSNRVLSYCSFWQSAELFECLRRLQLMALSVETLKVWSFDASKISSSIYCGYCFLNLFWMDIIDCFYIRPQRLESRLILSESTTQRMFGIYLGHWLSK